MPSTGRRNARRNHRVNPIEGRRNLMRDLRLEYPLIIRTHYPSNQTASEFTIRRALISRPYFRPAIRQILLNEPEKSALFELYVQTQELRRIAALTDNPTTWTTETLDIPTSLVNIHETMEMSLYAMLEDKGVFEDLGGLGRPYEQGEGVAIRTPTTYPRRNTRPPRRQTPREPSPFHRTPTPFPRDLEQTIEHDGHEFLPYAVVDPTTLYHSSQESLNSYHTPPPHPEDAIRLDLYGHIVDEHGQRLDVYDGVIDVDEYLDNLHPRRPEVIEILDDDEEVQGSST